MSILKAAVYDGGLLRQISPGDILAGSEAQLNLGSTATLAIPAAAAGYPIIVRNPGSASTDTFDSAANIVAALMPAVGMGSIGIQPGTTWRQTWINNGAGAITLAVTANTGMTITNASIGAGQGKELLFTVTNGTPAQAYSGLTTNASAVVTGFTPDQLKNLTPGMVVTNAVAGLQGTTILSINFQAGSITFSGNANATNTTPVVIQFSPVISVLGIRQGAL